MSEVAVSREKIGFFLVIVSSVGFASKSIFVKLAYAYDSIDTITILAMRMVFALTMLGVIVLIRRLRGAERISMTRQDWLWTIGLGLTGYYLSSLLDFASLAYITASLERMIIYLYPTMVVLLTAALYRRRIPRRVWGTMALSYGGIALVFVEELGVAQTDVWFGSLLAVGAALTYALYLMGTARVVSKIGALNFTSRVMIVCATAIFVHFLCVHSLSEISIPLPALGYGAFLGFFSTMLPIYALAAGISMMGAPKASMVSMAGPLMTLLLGAVFLGERLTGLQMGGVALIMFGVGLTGRLKTA